jgi:FixJ family two-component response regulator
MSGNKLAEHAVAEHPDLRVVVASGYGALPASAESEALRNAVLLQKPYTQQGLANAIDATMRSSAR